VKAIVSAHSSANGNAASSAAESGTSTERQSHALTFTKVPDGRKQAIRGLWVRNGRFYAQLKVENPITGIKKTRRVPLVDKQRNPVTTVAQAVAELRRLHTQRADNALPVLERTPKFADNAKRYLDFVASGQGAKKFKTVQEERRILARWSDTIGELRLDQIKRVHINRFIEARLKENVSPRTINVAVIALRVVMKRALADALIQRLPTEGLRPLTTTQHKRPLFRLSSTVRPSTARRARPWQHPTESSAEQNPSRSRSAKSFGRPP